MSWMAHQQCLGGGVNYRTLDKYFLMCTCASPWNWEVGGNQQSEGLSKGNGLGEQMKKRRERDRGRVGSGRNPCTSQLPETEERERDGALV